MTRKKKVVSISIFKPSISGHGGQKRTNQICELLSQFDHHHVVSPFSYTTPKVPLKTKIRRSTSIPYVLQTDKSLTQIFKPSKLLNESYRVFDQNRQLDVFDMQLRGSSTVVWENNFPDFFRYPQLLKHRYGVKVIACPQNIEALVPHQTLRWQGRTKLDFLKQELRALESCDEIFTISEEEQWLLNLFDLPAKFLPSYPHGALFDNAMAMRNIRTSRQQGDYFLIVGSVGNPPTKAGMLALLKSLQKLRINKKIRFIVGGFGTEVFQSEFVGVPQIEILGALDERTLNSLMSECRAMIIGQGYSTGALTKIPEILISGIPVIVDMGASRTYRRTHGVYVYQNESELGDLLNMNLPMPDSPAVPVAAFQIFNDAIA